MTDPRAHLHALDGAPTLRMERRFAHPPEKVWRAVSDPREMAAWFPATVDTEVRPGATMRFTFADAPDTTDATSEGEVLEVDPPKVYMFRWNRDVLRFELVPDGAGTLLVFTHVLGGGAAGRRGAARTAVGWDRCLAALAAALDGAAPAAAEGAWLADLEHYIAAFGLDTGTCETTADGYVLRFDRDMMWQPVETLWGLLVEDGAPAVGEAAPLRATNQHVEAGPLTVVEPPTALAYEWRHDGTAAGVVRFEFHADPDLGVHVALTQTVPRELASARAELLAAWHVHLELFFAASQGEVRCPWPADRVAALTDRYEADLAST
ncbi:Activator of Hsp90 ATPase homolog 1-like protein [Nocardia farcinica]|uniref:SRPBCC domain-containing protein n=1 Tax=Nocardia farcinica TaxID=37329 RepID=UPI000DFC1B79|nr:SRPBCC domain-containing protein [Nocardia farcinica]SUE28189.1 Activator of Hsp90 ATPase homolog 1-like protein [Nocardia farcinica]